MKPATALTLLLAALLACSAAAQAPAPTCASKLGDCAGDLNATKPSTKCCASLKEAVSNELPCLCALLQNTALIRNFGINITQALELPKRCGVTSDTTVCKTIGATPGAAASPSGAPATPSATPATPKPAGNNSAASANSVTWAVMYVLTSSLFFWWSVA